MKSHGEPGSMHKYKQNIASQEFAPDIVQYVSKTGAPVKSPAVVNLSVHI